MSLLSFHEVHVSFGAQVVLDRADLAVHPGDRLGVVGPNGAGKTTLLKVILGQVVPSIGQVHRPRNLAVGYLPQEIVAASQTTLSQYLRAAFASTDQVIEAINRVGEQLAEADADDQPALLKRLEKLQAELDSAGGYHYESRIGQVSAGLGIGDIEPDRPMSSLSGGQLSRAALAKLLLAEPDLLLLDEPTNHLDLAATEWLEEFLLSFAGTVLVVSHDRYLLGKVASKILEISDSRLRLYGMGFADYLATRQTQRLQQEREYEQQQAYIARQREFIARFHAGQRSREARGRKTRLERMIRDGELSADQPAREQSLRFDFRIDQPGGQTVLRCNDVCKSFGRRVLFDRFNLEVGRGHKLGICGANGVGKTTLLRMMLGQLSPDRGRCRLAEGLDVGYLDQHLATLEQTATVLQFAAARQPDMPPSRLRAALARFGFSADDLGKTPATLSGGEQTRLALLGMVLAGHHVLLFDEPTNHLDMQARGAMEEALAEYPGTIIAVSHDRYFLDRVADRLLVLGAAGRHEYHIGNYSDYQRTLSQRRSEAETPRPTRKPSPSGPRAPQPDDSSDWPEEIRPLAKLSVVKLEGRIIELEAELEQLHNRCADPKVYADPAAIADLGRRMASLKSELARYNAAWERRAV